MGTLCPNKKREIGLSVTTLCVCASQGNTINDYEISALS
jgi:hypothetical protein